MTIRLRLTLWYVLVLTLGLAIFAGTVYVHVEGSSRTAFDQVLEARSLALVPYVGGHRGVYLASSAPDEATGQLGTPSIWIRVVDSSGHQVPGGSQGLPLAGAPIELLRNTHPGFRDYGSLRVFVLPASRGGRDIAFIQTVTTTTQLDSSTAQLLDTMLVAGGLLIVLAALGGFFIARIALRPIHRVTETARNIGAGDLSRRVSPVDGPRSRRRRSRKDELTALMDTFDGMLSRLEDADQRRRQLTADVAHELVTPVAAIQSDVELAIRRPRTEAEYRDALGYVAEEAAHLQHIVDDLLFLASADGGNLPMSQDLVEIDQVCRSVVRALRPVAEKRGVEMVLDLPPRVVLIVGDELRLSQVVRNLLDNAVNHSPAGGEVAVSIKSNRGPTGSVTISVADMGLGIPAAEAERVFERFHRLVETTDAQDQPAARRGAGLGLAICKAVVEAHGGSICLGNPGSPGAIFIMELPVVGTPAPL